MCVNCIQIWLFTHPVSSPGFPYYRKKSIRRVKYRLTARIATLYPLCGYHNNQGDTMTRTGEEIDPIDAHVGERIKLARRLAGISQQTLAKDCGGVSFQQVQKYETGGNRVSASRLVMIARVLKKPVAYFFEGLPEYPVTELADNASLKIVERMRRLNERQQTALMGLIEVLS
jgi:transcriptional regulator with XRE-family HTH domain